MIIYSIENGSHSDDTFTYAVLPFGVTWEQANEIVHKLERLAEKYNKDVETLEEVLKKYNSEHKATYKSWDVIPMPKYPAQVPKGTKDLADAFPEIYAARKEAEEKMQKQQEEARTFNLEVDRKAIEYMLPFVLPIKQKYPRFTATFHGYNHQIGFGQIWNKFSVVSNHYMDFAEIENLI